MKKKNIIKKILLLLVTLILILLVFTFIKKIVFRINDNRIKNSLNELINEKIDYVFVDINPSMVLTVKNNKVLDLTCLNDDCLSIYNDINIKDININESIDKIYNASKEKGFNIDSGVKIKTTGNIDITKKEYITIEYINNKTKDLLLNDTNDSNDKYYESLWNELKKDIDYDKVYTCNMDNKELKCNIIYQEDLSIGVDDKDMGLSRLNRFRKLLEYTEKMSRVFNKFNIKTDSDTDMGIFFELSSIYINDIQFEFNIYDWIFRNYDDENMNKYFELSDLNLLNPNEVLSKLKSEYYKEDWCLEETEITNGIKKRYVDCNNSSRIDKYNFFICDIEGQNCNSVSKEEYDLIK